MTLIIDLSISSSHEYLINVTEEYFELLIYIPVSMYFYFPRSPGK